MKQLKITIFFVLLISPFVGESQVSISNEKALEIDRYIEYIMNEQKIPGLALAITHKGKVLKKQTYGLASIAYNVPVTDSSTFWLASVSKHIVATAIMQLYEKGTIGLDDKIHKHLIDAPANWEGITIRHLLTHTSGLPSSSSSNYLTNRSAIGTYSAEQIYNNAKKDTLVFKPGDDYLYSDEGIYLLGYIINKISGLSFNEYMEKMIFKPSGMKSSYMMDHFKIQPNQVTGYSIRNDEVIPDRNSYRLIDTELNAAGGIYATIDDMINWESAMIHNVNLSQKSKDLMWISQKLNNNRLTYYGFCWNTQLIKNKRVIYHPGVAGTEYLRFVDDETSIIVLTNQAKYQRAITQEVAQIIGFPFSLSAEDLKTATVSSAQPEKEEMQRLVGEYEFTPNENYYVDHKIIMDIVMKGNELWLVYPAKHKYRKETKLAKLENGRWIQLSWELTFVETSFEMLKENNNILIKMYEDYNLGYDLLVGELKKRS